MSDERLLHSIEGLERLSQIESARLHIYVEGVNGDKFYYHRILSKTISDRGLDVEFHLSRDIPGNGEGKLKCLSFFKTLQERKNLVSNLDGKFTVIGFILDKDIDDILGKLEVSPHIVYTEEYSVENHIVSETNVAEALAATLGIDAPTVRSTLQNQENWLDSCCDLWQEWVALCIFAHSSKCGIKNYKRLSQVNEPASGPTNHELVDAFVSLIGQRLGIDIGTAKREYEVALRIVLDHKDRRQRNSLFNGKWYSMFIADLGKRILSIGSVDENMVWASLRSHVVPDHPKSNRFREFLIDLAELLPN